MQEAVRKDIERAFGVVQIRFHILVRPSPERHYQRYDPQVVRDAVKYILGDRNIQVLSWGRRKVDNSGTGAEEMHVEHDQGISH